MSSPDKADLNQYANLGYVLLPNLLSSEETIEFRNYARSQLESECGQGRVMTKGDSEGRKTLLRMWNSAENDKYGLLARDQRLVAFAEAMIGSPIYLYSHKMTMKQPNEGGAWEWHQDFGYWHNYGCLAPDMMSIYIALDKTTSSNGCLQVLRGSHRLGRLDHIRVHEQMRADPEYVEAALQRFEHVFVEMEPGDALAFHGNLLHRSDANRTDTYRWGYICSYNAVHNAPFKQVRDYGHYEPLSTVPAGSFRNAPK